MAGQDHVKQLIEMGQSDEDGWVRLVAEVMQPFPEHGTLNCIDLSSTQPTHPILMKRVKEACKSVWTCGRIIEHTLGSISKVRTYLENVTHFK